MYALADCNNFFVSCERVFRPDLNGKPVIVLSNNDGCAIARSNEAKALGIKMGDPYFKIRDLVQKHDVTVFSGNMALYGDMSRRVREVLCEFAPQIEVYSIDEAFLDLRGMDDRDFDSLAKLISQRCLRYTGIPVSVGIAPTKTLAKIASKLCKKYPKLKGGCYMHRTQDIEKVLRKFPIEDVWGIGRRSAPKLQAMGIHTAWDYVCIPEQVIRSMSGITGVRTWKELHAEPCIEFEQGIDSKQSICNSRSFEKELSSLSLLQEQVANFAAMTAEKLRSQRSVCSQMTVFVMTNRFHPSAPQSYASALVTMSPTCSTRELVSAAVRTTRTLFREGFAYKKAGVIANRIQDSEGIAQSLFDDSQAMVREQKLMNAIDSINRELGYGTVRMARQGSGTVLMAKQHQSPHYTTSWKDIPTAHTK